MALICTPRWKLQFSSTKIGWGESGPVHVSDTWLANYDASQQGDFERVWHWPRDNLNLQASPPLECSKTFFAQFPVFELIEWLVSRAWKQTLPGTTPVLSLGGNWLASCALFRDFASWRLDNLRCLAAYIAWHSFRSWKWAPYHGL